MGAAWAAVGTGVRATGTVAGGAMEAVEKVVAVALAKRRQEAQAAWAVAAATAGAAMAGMMAAADDTHREAQAEVEAQVASVSSLPVVQVVAGLHEADISIPCLAQTSSPCVQTSCDCRVAHDEANTAATYLEVARAAAPSLVGSFCAARTDDGDLNGLTDLTWFAWAVG